MEIIEKKYTSLVNALETLEEALMIIEDPDNQRLYNSLRDSVIQRFEYSIDTLWKFLKFYIQDKEKIDLETSSPRIILRYAESTGLIDPQLHETLIDCLSDRNLTSHVYNEETADLILKNIPRYYDAMKSITDKLNIKNEL